MSSDIRSDIIASLFTPDAGGVAEKLLIHLKVFEDLKQGDLNNGAGIMGKPRYLCLTQKRNRCKLYKTKRNQNNTFTIGKSWSIEDIRQIEVIDKNQFSVILNKQYVWSVEKPVEKMLFLAHIVDTSQRFINRTPRLINVDEGQLLRLLTNRSAQQILPTVQTSHSHPQLPPSSSSSRNNLPETNIQSKSTHNIHSASSSIVTPSPSTSSGVLNRRPSQNRTAIINEEYKPPQKRAPVINEDYKSPTTSVSTFDHSMRKPSHSSIQQDKSHDERKEREKLREQRREHEKREREIQEERMKQKKALELQDKITEEESLLNVEEILTDFNWKTSGNAAVLENRLLGELHALEAANVHAIIQSDERVQSVVERIDKALRDLDNMDSWLSLYAAELNSMGDDIREIESQNRGLQILTVNQNNLIRELDNVLSSISIQRESLDQLKYEPMESTDDIIRIQDCAENLQKVLKIKLDDNLHELRAVQEMLETYNGYNNEFSTRIYEFLKSKFDHLARTFLDNKTPPQRKLPKANPHDQIEDALIRYQGFALWQKEMEPRAYNELQRHYASAMAPTYERDIREMVDVTRPFFTNLRGKSLDDVDYIFRSDESRSARALAYGAKLGTVATGGSNSGMSNDSSRYKGMLRNSVDGHGGRSSMDEDEKATSEAFSQLVDQCAKQVCREQNFICDLFEQSPYAPKTFLDRGPVYSTVPDKSRLYSRREKIRDVKISKKVQNWMEIIFESLEPSIIPLVEYGIKNDPTQTVSMLVAVEFQLEKWKGSDQEFIFNFFDSLLLRILRSFKQFITDQIKIIDDTKVSSKKRRGILPTFRTFPLFVQRLEMLANGLEHESQTRNTINSSYDKIITSMMSSLDTIAKESDETGDDKEQLNANIMYIENMHHFYHALRSRKISVLDIWVKEAKAKYEYNSSAYIKIVIRRPLGKLLEFFDGVDGLLRTSKPEEIAFHVNYNKTQLRRVIAIYPPKEVRKALEVLYKRVDKHFSEEEGLLQVVWRGIQEELIEQHGRIEGLIDKCYPDAGVHLEFSIQDLLAKVGDQVR